jgi:hypothetical protein
MDEEYNDEDDGEPEVEFIQDQKEKKLNELEVINIIGKFSKQNMRFISDMKRGGLYVSNEKKKKKHHVVAKLGDYSCKVTFDYDALDIKTEGDEKFCSELRKRIK